MPTFLSSWLSRLAGFSLLLLPALSHAQCPTAAACTPGAASAASSLTSVYKLGIYNVKLGTINNTSPSMGKFRSIDKAAALMGSIWPSWSSDVSDKSMRNGTEMRIVTVLQKERRSSELRNYMWMAVMMKIDAKIEEITKTNRGPRNFLINS